MTLGPRQAQVFEGRGGVPPYSYAVASGPGVVDPALGTYIRPWAEGPATIRVSDTVGSSVQAQVTFQPGSVLLGSNGDDDAWSVLVDGDGDIYVAGAVTGVTPGVAGHGGASDYLLARLDRDGALRWLVRGGTTGLDVPVALVFWSPSRIAVAGYTDGVFPAAASGGGYDMFLAVHLREDGGTVGVMQHGGAGDEFVFGAGRGPGDSICVTGSVNDTLDGHVPAGDWDGFLVLWGAGGIDATATWGTAAYDTGTACQTDGLGNTLVAGHTRGTLGTASFGDHDVTLGRLVGGNVTTYAQLGGTGYDRAYALAVVPGATAGVSSVVLVGDSNSPVFRGQDLHGMGQPDCLVVEVDGAGGVTWARLLGTNSVERCWGVALGAGGQVFVAGSTDGELPGQVSRGGPTDAALFALGADGSPLYAVQVGTAAVDEMLAVGVDGTGAVVSLGNTGGALDDTPRVGGRDLLLLKFGLASGQRL